MRVLVLSGGGAKGFAFLGVLKALDEHRRRPDVIIGTSVGALVGVGYSILGSADDLIEFSVKLVGNLRMPRFKCGFHSVLSKFFLSIFVSTFDHLISMDPYFKRIERYLDGMRIENLKTKVVIVSGDVKHGRMVVFDEGPIVDALKSTVLIPGIFPPMRRNDEVLCDGGVINNLPVDVALKYKPDEIIAVRVKDVEEERDLSTAVGIMMMMDSVRSERFERMMAEKSNLFIEIITDGIDLLDFAKGVKLIEVGYRKALEFLKCEQDRDRR